MKHFSKIDILLSAAIASASLTACSDDDATLTPSEGSYVGQKIGNFDASEWYPGGTLGTTNNTSAGCFEQETPVIDDNKTFYDLFFDGEGVFEKQYTINNAPYKGLGPASVRASCLDCHPAYGHGKWQEAYTTRYGNGNGYLLAIYHPKGTDDTNSDGLSNDGSYISEVTGMPQTQATAPFKAPIDENGIHLQWLTLKTTEAQNDVWPKHVANGVFTYPDGTAMPSLQYPDIRIDLTAFHTDPLPTNIAVRLESTIGVGGTGLIDAIPQDSIEAQYRKEAKYFAMAHGVDSVKYFLNPSFWDAPADGFAASAFYTKWGSDGFLADGTAAKNGQYKALKRFTYALTRASLQDGPGANAVWNITNVSRPDRPYLYTTNAWAKAMSEDPEVIAKIKADPTSPYYGDGTEDSIKACVYNLLRPGTNQFNNPWHNFTAEMSADKFYEFMVWHRGLAIPRARNLNDATVQRGKELFYKWGCTSCHRPKWQTTTDNYWLPGMLEGKKLPQYANQTIYPYSDFVQHKLYMKNDIHGSWCRTTPLWGRGLEKINTGREDRLHDCRARNEEEAILWHMYNKKSHAYHAALNFYNASKADREAVIKFIQSI